MNNAGIVYTLHNECQDCYKCVRRCPVKSIRIQNGHAGILSEKCIGWDDVLPLAPVTPKGFAVI